MHLNRLWTFAVQPILRMRYARVQPTKLQPWTTLMSLLGRRAQSLQSQNHLFRIHLKTRNAKTRKINPVHPRSARAVHQVPPPQTPPRNITHPSLSLTISKKSSGKARRSSRRSTGTKRWLFVRSIPSNRLTKPPSNRTNKEIN